MYAHQEPQLGVCASRTAAVDRMSALSIEQLCRDRQLLEHPEGGFFRETINDCYEGEARPRFTSIEFLLPSGRFSTMHRLDASEIWYHHLGSTLLITEIEPFGLVHHTKLGAGAGEQLQHLVRSGNWFGARVLEPDTYALVGCAVSPGFVWEGFEMASRQELCKTFPHAVDDICSLTHESAEQQ